MGAASILTAALALRASVPIDDPDTWWHLRLGDEFRTSWSLAEPGQLTPFADRPWFATQWTLEILASYVEDLFGLRGVAWLAGVSVVLLAVAIYWSCRQMSSTAAAALTTIVCLLASALSHGPRPQMASFIFLAVAMGAWIRIARDLRPRWWLVPLSWLWACTHGMWFIGVGVGVVVLAGVALDRRLDMRTAIRLGLIPLLSLLAATLTPVGPKLVMAPLATSQMTFFIEEWQPPDFSEFVPAIAIGMGVLLAIAWSRADRQPWVNLLLFCWGLVWILLYYRTIAVGAVILSPLVSAAVQSWMPLDRLRPPRWETVAGVSISAAIVVGLIGAEVDRNVPPLNGLNRLNGAITSLPRGTVILNEYELGGWLEWKHRHVIPVVDGLTDAYSIEYVTAYISATQVERGWRRFLTQVDAQYALLSVDSPLASALEDDGWIVSERQSDYVLLKDP